MYNTIFIISSITLAASALTLSPILPKVPDDFNNRIVGGSEVYIWEYPHQISMQLRGRHRCGGSIYRPDVIISAAHCVVGLNSTDGLTIVAGSSQLSIKGQELEVYKIIVHENYKTLNNDYDVAILFLKGSFKLNAVVKSIALAKELPETDTWVTVTGWGTTTEGGVIPNNLLGVNVQLIDHSKCKKSYLYTVTSRMVCAGVENGGKDACQGDSGGPLVHNNELLGIVSWGTGCARPKYPGVYASVPLLYPWIVEVANQNFTIPHEV